MAFGSLDIVTPPTPGFSTAKTRVLVVDDSRFQRRILTASLRGLGYDVIEASSGEDALAICRADLPDLVLSDWVMPGMSGLDFCKAFRKISQHQFAYFIMLTAKSDKTEVALGLDTGADDFLSKPVTRNELRARIGAGERILEMHCALRRSNTLLTETVDELQDMYDALERDLQEAKTLQQSLLREPFKSVEHGNVSLLLRSSGHVGGDLVGHFPAGENQLGLFALDVSGHGISSALMTARLAGYLSASSPDHNVSLERLDDGTYTARAPKDVVFDLNDLILGEMKTEHYFTLMLAIVDLATGKVTICQAGHPHPVVLRKDGRVEQFGTGGFPVGLLMNVDFQQFELQLEEGDRLLILSDGVTECPDPAGQLLEEEGVKKIMHKLRDQHGPSFLDGLMSELENFAEHPHFPDDVSAILFEFDGPT